MHAKLAQLLSRSAALPSSFRQVVTEVLQMQALPSWKAAQESYLSDAAEYLAANLAPSVASAAVAMGPAVVYLNGEGVECSINLEFVYGQLAVRAVCKCPDKGSQMVQIESPDMLATLVLRVHDVLTEMYDV